MVPRRLLTAGLIAAGAMLGIPPAAMADHPVPGPDPVPSPGPLAAPVPTAAPGMAGCQGGEVMKDGNCVPNMTPVNTGEQAMEQAPLRVTDDQTSSVDTGVPANLVPNLNGTPCTGYWTSAACDAVSGAAAPSVVPHSTLSDSP